MLLAPAMPRAHLARHPAGVNQDRRNGSFGGVPLQSQRRNKHLAADLKSFDQHTCETWLWGQ
jgi:hypothetical protein